MRIGLGGRNPVMRGGRGGEGVMRGRYEKLLWGGFDERALWEIVMRGCDVLVCVSDRS